MGHVVKTSAGTYRANWRDSAGRQTAKTFRTKKEAVAFLAEMETSVARGTYVDPHAGRIRLGEYANRWLAARNSGRSTSARDESLMRNHVLPAWGSTPLARIDHTAVQAWVTRLGEHLAPATVAKCHGLLSLILRAAVRDRLIAANPAADVRLPANRTKDTDDQVITPDVLIGALLPAIPPRHRALVALAGGTGLRWGECAGLRWDAVDMDAGLVSVIRVATEVAGTVTIKPFPKSQASRRTVPLPRFVLELLVVHARRYPAGPAGEVFTNLAGGPLRRTLFRSRVWRPALVDAGLLGRVEVVETHRYRAVWRDEANRQHSEDLPTRRQAVHKVAREAHGGLRFHDLRHSYATYLVSAGVPVNDVQKVMGHEQASTTLNRYTHASGALDSRVRAVWTDFSLTHEINTSPGA